MRSLTTLALLVALCAATAAAGRALEDAAAAAGDAGRALLGDAPDCVYTKNPKPPKVTLSDRWGNGATFFWALPAKPGPACLSFVQYQFVEGKGKPSDDAWQDEDGDLWGGELTHFVNTEAKTPLAIYMRSVQVSPLGPRRYSSTVKKSTVLFLG